MTLIGVGESARATREQRVVAALVDGYRACESVTITTTNGDLTDRMVNVLEVDRLVAPPWLSERQAVVIRLAYGHDLDDGRIARALGLSRRTIGAERRAAITLLVRVLWDDPDYTPTPTPTPRTVTPTT